MKQNIIFLTLFAAIIAVMSIGMLALPHEDFSEEENRALAGAPRATLESVLDGRYFSRLSAFCSDAVPCRKALVRASALCDLALGKGQSRGVLRLGERLVDRLEYESTATLEENIAALAEAKEQGAVAAIVPRSADVYLEGEAVDSIYNIVSKRMGTWELRERLKNETDAYYKTDHHLTAEGAYVLYEYVARELGVEPYPESAFERQMFSEEFFGSTYSKCGMLAPCADEVVLMRYEGDGSYTVRCEDSGCELSGLYCAEAADIKDKYRVFTDGNHGLMYVKKEDGASRPTLLVYKDSFANAVLPLLARHFDLAVYDPRYTDVQPPEYDRTALIMGVDTLASQRDLS